MALAILDGAQTATTLSTILSSGQHITAHTIVSLGTQAVTDITGAVSGSVVTIPNLNVLARSVATDGIADGTLNFFKIGGHQDGSNQTAHIVHVSSGGAMKVDASDSTVTFGTIRGTVTIGNSVTIGSLPAISGTVTIGAGTAQIGSVTASIFGVDILGSTTKVQPSLSSMDETFSEASSGYTLITKIASSGGNPINPLSNTELRATAVTIAGSVTASLAISSTAITSGSFSSLTSATLVPGNVARKMATVYNLGAGQLFVNAGASATTLGGGFMVALSSGDFYECGFTTTTLSAIYATAGTCSWMSH